MILFLACKYAFSISDILSTFLAFSVSYKDFLAVSSFSISFSYFLISFVLTIAVSNTLASGIAFIPANFSWTFPLIASDQALSSYLAVSFLASLFSSLASPLQSLQAFASFSSYFRNARLARPCNSSSSSPALCVYSFLGAFLSSFGTGSAALASSLSSFSYSLAFALASLSLSLAAESIAF